MLSLPFLSVVVYHLSVTVRKKVYRLFRTAAEKSSRNVKFPLNELTGFLLVPGSGSGDRYCTSSSSLVITGQPSLVQVAGARKVSRAILYRSPSYGRHRRNTGYQVPFCVCTRSACPVVVMGSFLDRSK